LSPGYYVLHSKYRKTSNREPIQIFIQPNQMKRIRHILGQCMLRTPLNKWYTEFNLTSYTLLPAAKKLYLLVTEPELN